MERNGDAGDYRPAYGERLPATIAAAQKMGSTWNRSYRATPFPLCPGTQRIFANGGIA